MFGFTPVSLTFGFGLALGSIFDFAFLPRAAGSTFGLAFRLAFGFALVFRSSLVVVWRFAFVALRLGFRFGVDFDFDFGLGWSFCFTPHLGVAVWVAEFVKCDRLWATVCSAADPLTACFFVKAERRGAPLCCRSFRVADRNTRGTGVGSVAAASLVFCGTAGAFALFTASLATFRAFSSATTGNSNGNTMHQAMLSRKQTRNSGNVFMHVVCELDRQLPLRRCSQSKISRIWRWCTQEGHSHTMSSGKSWQIRSNAC